MPGGPQYGAHPWHYGGPPVATMLTPFVIMTVLMLALLAFRGIQNLVAAVGRRRAAKQAAAALDVTVPMLTSDRDREQAAQRIAHAVGEGRLGLEEAEHRIDTALRARWDRDLEAVLHDLPMLPTSDRGRARQVGVLAGVALLTAVAVTIQVAVGLWELWPLAVAVAAVPALRRR